MELEGLLEATQIVGIPRVKNHKERLDTRSEGTAERSEEGSRKEGVLNCDCSWPVVLAGFSSQSKPCPPQASDSDWPGREDRNNEIKLLMYRLQAGSPTLSVSFWPGPCRGAFVEVCASEGGCRLGAPQDAGSLPGWLADLENRLAGDLEGS